MPTTQWSSGNQTTLLPFCSLLPIKGKHVAQCLVSGKVKTHPRWGTQAGRPCCDSKRLRLPALHLATWGGGKWLDPSLPAPRGPSFPWHILKKINQYSGRVTGMPPLTRDLWSLQGSPQRARRGFVSAPCPTLTKFSCWGEERGVTLSTSDTINPAEEFKVAWPAADPVSGNPATSWGAFSHQLGWWTSSLCKTEMYSVSSWEALVLSWEVLWVGVGPH